MTSKFLSWWDSTPLAFLLKLVADALRGGQQSLSKPNLPVTEEISPFGSGLIFQSQQGNEVLFRLSFQLSGVTTLEVASDPDNLTQLIKAELERLSWPDFYADYLARSIPVGVERGAEFLLTMKLPWLIKSGYPELASRDISVSKVSVAFSRCLPTMSVVEMAEAILEEEAL